MLRSFQYRITELASVAIVGLNDSTEQINKYFIETPKKKLQVGYMYAYWTVKYTVQCPDFHTYL